MQPSISWDGRLVAFESRAPNLVEDDNNGSWDAFVRDRLTGRTERVSVTSAGKESTPASATTPDGPVFITEMMPSISGNGRFVAFRSRASDLVGADANDNYDTFVHDRVTHRTEMVSVDSNGRQGPAGYGTHQEPAGPRQAISFDGSRVAFVTAAPLVADDTNGFEDVYVRDRRSGRTLRASISSSGAQSTTQSTKRGAAISPDGRFVAFHSDDTALVPGDTNGVLDVFVHDVTTRTTVRVSVTATGEALEGSSSRPFLTDDGRVAFHSTDAPVEPGPQSSAVGPEGYQVFVHERPPP